jgi:DNA topoisomerase VI B subunit
MSTTNSKKRSSSQSTSVGGGVGKKSKSSELKSQSPAEFFAKHQNIAGFDNAGKALFTTIREFVENALDAAEAIPALPNITLHVDKLTKLTFDAIRNGQQLDEQEHLTLDEPIHIITNEEDEDKTKPNSEEAYFRVKCKDNGTGMSHEDIPRMLGVVLSSTKYDLKQTRGKFGLGAKMALVWSKKSTGLPIEVYSSTSTSGPVSYYKLDLDVQSNSPNILESKKIENTEKWRGTEISVIIRGKWTTYRHKILSYMRQLAIITPYADFLLRFTDRENIKKSFVVQFSRRTDQIPIQPQVVKHHPSAVDNLLVETLIKQTKQSNIAKFLSSEFSNVSNAVAKEIHEKLGAELTLEDLDRARIHRLTEILRATSFPPPSGSVSQLIFPFSDFDFGFQLVSQSYR